LHPLPLSVHSPSSFGYSLDTNNLTQTEVGHVVKNGRLTVDDAAVYSPPSFGLGSAQLLRLHGGGTCKGNRWVDWCTSLPFHSGLFIVFMFYCGGIHHVLLLFLIFTHALIEQYRTFILEAFGRHWGILGWVQ
jgi:hypothetical protein